MPACPAQLVLYPSSNLSTYLFKEESNITPLLKLPSFHSFASRQGDLHTYSKLKADNSFRHCCENEIRWLNKIPRISTLHIVVLHICLLKTWTIIKCLNPMTNICSKALNWLRHLISYTYYTTLEKVIKRMRDSAPIISFCLQCLRLKQKINPGLKILLKPAMAKNWPPITYLYQIKSLICAKLSIKAG